jgi:hypothetical protein
MSINAGTEALRGAPATDKGEVANLVGLRRKRVASRRAFYFDLAARRDTDSFP